MTKKTRSTDIRITPKTDPWEGNPTPPELPPWEETPEPIEVLDN